MARLESGEPGKRKAQCRLAGWDMPGSRARPGRNPGDGLAGDFGHFYTVIENMLSRRHSGFNLYNGRFMTLFFTRDDDDFWESDLQYDPNAQLIPIWRDTGLYDGQGNPRPALDTWRAALQRPKS